MSDKLYSQYINRLRVPDFKFKGFIRSSDNSSYADWDLSGLKKINIFIGANNAGKSRLIRHLFITDISEIDSDKSPVCEYSNLEIKMVRTGVDKANFEQLQNNLKNAPNLCSQHFFHILNKQAKSVLFQHSNSVSDSEIRSLCKEYIQELQANDNFAFISKYTQINFKKVYIPLLRGLRTLHVDTDYLKERTKKDYFEGSPEDINIFTGHSLYEDLKKSLLSTYEERKKVHDFEAYLSKSFFNNQQVSLIPRIGENVVYLKKGNKEERAIYNLGDGLQAIIILTFKVFMEPKPTMFFIEEPEQNLHPSMQRSLIEAFSSHPQHMYFITTHSNHFIDLSQETDNVGIQRVYQQIEHNVETTIIESASKDADILADLGVRASSVLLANSSIWVEGITDKLYLRAYMSKFISELADRTRSEKLLNYKENLHYIFTEYQGCNITHWDFDDDRSHITDTTPARAVTSNIMLIADKDIDSKGNRVSELTAALGAKFELLDVKEIENLIPEVILKKTAKEQWNGKQNRDKYNATFDENKIAQTGYSNNIGIGRYLERKVNKTLPDEATEKDKKHTFFADKSGTIKAKVAFCNIAIKHMNNGETMWNLTPDLTALCDKIWTHIESSNG